MTSFQERISEHGITQTQHTINFNIKIEQETSLRNPENTYWPSRLLSMNITNGGLIFSFKNHPEEAFQHVNNLDSMGIKYEDLYEHLVFRGVAASSERNNDSRTPPSLMVAGQGDPATEVWNNMDGEFWEQGDKLFWCLPDPKKTDHPQGMILKKYKPKSEEEIIEGLSLMNEYESPEGYDHSMSLLYDSILKQSSTLLGKANDYNFFKDDIYKIHTAKIFNLIDKVKNSEKRRIIGMVLNDIPQGKSGPVLITYFR
jgi:hypothetical protein